MAPLKENKIIFNHSLDQGWHTKLLKIGVFSSHEYFDVPDQERCRQQELFLSGRIDNPKFSYPRLKRFDTRAREVQLAALAREIASQERNKLVQEAYQNLIQQKISECRLLGAAATGHKSNFVKFTKEVFGWPSPLILSTAANHFEREAKQKLVNQGRGDVFLALLGNVKRITTPQAEALARVYLPDRTSHLRHFVGRKLAGLDPDRRVVQNREYLPAEVKIIFQRALERIGAKQWQAVIDNDKVRYAVDHRSRKIFIPARRKIGGRHLRALLVHEVGIHVWRRVNGEKQILQLLGTGLAHYVVGEEGLAMQAERILWKKQEPMRNDVFFNEGYFLAAAFAAGLDGRPRNFRQTFQCLCSFLEFKAQVNNKQYEELHRKIAEDAFNNCFSVFRGTDCVTPGVFYSKDISYTEGYLRIGQLMREHPEEISRFDAGKYDPANESHRRLLDQLGIQG